MTAIARKGLLWLVTFAATLFGGLIMVACLSLTTGCGQGQRVVSALAVAAVAADEANATAYEIQAADVLDDVQSEGGGFLDWCEAMQTPWERSSRAECAIESLADLALAGQHALDAGEDLDAEWAGAACEGIRALEAAWYAAEDPPAVVGTARGLVCGLADGARSGPPECVFTPTPPPCPSEVSP